MRDDFQGRAAGPAGVAVAVVAVVAVAAIMASLIFGSGGRGQIALLGVIAGSLTAYWGMSGMSSTRDDDPDDRA